MTNKKVIRRSNIAGQFTTIHNSILFDTRLSPIAFRLLVTILSDSDEFTLSQTLYKKRLGITENRVFLKAIKNLEDCGYLKKTQIGEDKFIPKIKKANSSKVVYHYTISEFGNLNSNNVIETPKIEIIEEINDVVVNEINNYVQSLSTLFSNDDFFQYFLNETSQLESLDKMKKSVNSYLRNVYKNELTKVANPDSNKKAHKELIEWLKIEIFNNHNLNVNTANKWLVKKMKYRKNDKFDYETQMSDYLESAKD